MMMITKIFHDNSTTKVGDKMVSHSVHFFLERFVSGRWLGTQHLSLSKQGKMIITIKKKKNGIAHDGSEILQ